MYSNELEVAKKIAYDAGQIMRQYFDGDQQRTIKSDGTPLTIADTTINSMVIERLAESFPDDILIGEEESTGSYGMGRRWFCDPIDGTKAFTWGVPTAMFSLGLVINGRPVVGVAYEPMLDKIYTAIVGEGSYCNGIRLSVNSDSLQTGILATVSSPYRIRKQTAYLEPLLDQRVEMATFSGSVARCVRIAEKRFVGHIGELVNPHDMAASEVIITEAGGKVTNLDGSEYDYTKPFRGTIVSNGLVHDELVSIYKNAS